jgi:hypothetical protein
MKNDINRLVLTIDFDNTLVDSEYPNILGLKKYAKEVMNKWYAQGIYLIINTCRNGEAEWECETFLFDNGVPFHKINDHAPFIKQKYFNPHHPISKKIFSHVNIDDTNLDFVSTKGIKPINWKVIDAYVQNIIDDGNWDVKPNFNFNYAQ